MVRRIAILLHDLRGGGAERVMLRLANGLAAAGEKVDLVLVTAKGEYLSDISPNVSLVDLKQSSVYKSIPSLARYLRTAKPAVIISGLVHVNIALLIAKRLTSSESKVVLTEHNQISIKAKKATSSRQIISFKLVKYLYRYADRIIAVSKGVAADLTSYAGLRPGIVQVIYNPIIHEDIENLAQSQIEHRWFTLSSVPVFVGVGRLQEQKGFDILIDAFKLVKSQRDSRLLIIGEGNLRKNLQRQIEENHLDEYVELAGFSSTPYAFMNRSAGFVLSSRWEGFPTVLVEAMACGARVVSTNCPSGPDEILENGTIAPLVPVDDPRALAIAMVSMLDDPMPSPALKQKAFNYTTEKAVRSYSHLINQIA